MKTEPVIPADAATAEVDGYTPGDAGQDGAPGDALSASDAGDCPRRSIASVTASADDGNVAENAIDGDLATRWSAQGLGQWIAFDLGGVVEVGRVAIAWHLGDERIATFDIELSADATSWSEVLVASSSGTTLELEAYDFEPQLAGHVRVVGQGNDANNWNSIAEVEIYGSCE